MDTAVIALTVGVALLAWKAWAFLDAWRWPADAYREADRLRRGIWLGVLGAAIVLQLWVGIWRPGENNTARLLNALAGAVVVLVYQFDVRPRLRAAAR